MQCFTIEPHVRSRRARLRPGGENRIDVEDDARPALQPMRSEAQVDRAGIHVKGFGSRAWDASFNTSPIREFPIDRVEVLPGLGREFAQKIVHDDANSLERSTLGSECRRLRFPID
jgi:hypothetical protein